MSPRRFPLGLLLPAALVVLVGTLATLQYRWLGEVSEAEHTRLQNVLRQRASDFADDFDRELLGVYVALQTGTTSDVTRDPASFADHYDAWRRDARDPQMLRGVFVADADHLDALKQFSPDTRTFAAASWPDYLGPVRGQIAHAHDAAPHEPSTLEPLGRVVMTWRDTVVPSVPALVTTLPDPSPPPVPGETHVLSDLSRLMTGSTSTTYLVIALDHDYLSRTMLPALAAKYFGGTDVNDYRLAVMSTGDSTPVYARGLADGRSLNPAHADASVTLLSLRPELMSQVTRAGGSGANVFTFSTNALRATTVPAPTPRGNGAGGGARAGGVTSNYSIVMRSSGIADAGVVRVGTPLMPASWTLVLQHTAGSLDAAVSNARTRNLWISFGILSVLIAGVGIVLVNAQRSQRLAAQQMDFVATVSHELRTPLAVIRSAAQNLSAGVVQEPAQARRYGDLIETEGRRLTDMVEQVLEYAGLTDGRRPRMARPIDVGALVDDAVATCAELGDASGVEFAVDVPADVPPVVADPDALRRAIGNLITNALKYGASGRWVGISARGASPRGEREVQIAVSDHGPGVDPEDAPHLFEPFYRGRRALERQIHGNGLGLSLVKRIVEAHGGRVTVSSMPGEGATFTLHVPAAAPDQARQPIGETAANAGGSVA